MTILHECMSPCSSVAIGFLRNAQERSCTLETALEGVCLSRGAKAARAFLAGERRLRHSTRPVPLRITGTRAGARNAWKARSAMPAARAAQRPVRFARQ
ncbi:hypothetical protein [Burkholderia pseudomallei]|uniref:hypothetical protein n=1 Tax=Burkholderia pseudomallei TaxID=28450 RepID=UPI000A1A0B68|nr:hypothetical protein [Burkholderia pseudomallei]ARK47190.1 hypothetical protein BOC35_13575 [Burkholderia pseudomallei]ARK57221.1 hypothetical protein BOC36_30400 [Burkholderia pseudomallei]ARL19456.1 hypothetical protein BOC46_29495 [Burkholderia pseudomallei]ARL26442.1 hypothetical protein BOC47_30005 [Burkholderia pseudomallei]ARL31999.1 hypothetical protein BOC48_21510 [Burkholderia pseudomallei]